ncbi:MAG: hypothetical protein ACP5OU_09620 [Methanothrix sp.]
MGGVQVYLSFGMWGFAEAEGEIVGVMGILIQIRGSVLSITGSFYKKDLTKTVQLTA